METEKENGRRLIIGDQIVDIDDVNLEPFGASQAIRLFADTAPDYIGRVAAAINVVRGSLPGLCPGRNSGENTAGLDHDEALRRRFNTHAACGVTEPSMATHITIMLTILELLYIAQDQPLRIASFGAGPALYELLLCSILKDVGVAYNMVCVDIAEAAIELRRKMLGTLARWRPQRYTFAAAPFSELSENIELTSLPSHSMDLVYCLSAIQLVRSRIRVIEEMRRVLDPDGLGYVVFVAYKYGWDDPSGEKLDELLDDLEMRGFEVQLVRKMRGGHGTGNLGQGRMDRVCVVAQLFRQQNRLSLSWRAKMDPSGLLALSEDNLDLASLLLGLDSLLD